MSIDTQPQGVSPGSTSTSTSTPSKPGDTTKAKDPDTEKQAVSANSASATDQALEKEKEQGKEDSKPSSYNPTTLLTTLLSPFTSTFTSTSPPPPPEAYYTPTEIPLFKRLQKTRLSRTREKQLLRAAEREYNDPPPQPAPGDCCGSSCDPCVRDLWGEEIGVWRGRWGNRALEKKEGKGEKRKEGGDASVQGSGTGNGNTGRKDLEW
ncbi:hypothetical protein N7508_000841 [Penicillium antarcticum]|uniref:uncharacterized protein n=1 Tax=Penicillium antarcticum TaxID=416450 RepID=UPI002383FE27|nr:uncharacterized protein N7508_000841 [Penicillium antarcticum]KAJ5320558.1 hypothetical protein N7508_000841 [Penicillium antarcticum]